MNVACAWGPWQAALSRHPLGPASPYLDRILRTHWLRILLLEEEAAFFSPRSMPRSNHRYERP